MTDEEIRNLIGRIEAMPSYQFSLDMHAIVEQVKSGLVKEPKTIKKEGWVNVFKYPTNSADRAAVVSNAYFTKEAADAESGSGSKRVACIRIEWEETLE